MSGIGGVGGGLRGGYPVNDGDNDSLVSNDSGVGRLGQRRLSTHSTDSQASGAHLDEAVRQASRADSELSVHSASSSLKELDLKTQKEVKSVARKIWRGLGGTLSKLVSQVKGSENTDPAVHFMEHLRRGNIDARTLDRTMDLLFDKGVPVTTLQAAVKEVNVVHSTKHRVTAGVQKLKQGLVGLWKNIKSGSGSEKSSVPEGAVGGGFLPTSPRLARRGSLGSLQGAVGGLDPEAEGEKSTLFSDAVTEIWVSWLSNHGSRLKTYDLDRIQGLFSIVSDVIDPEVKLSNHTKDLCLNAMKKFETALIETPGKKFNPLDHLEDIQSAVQYAKTDMSLEGEAMLSKEGMELFSELDFRDPTMHLLEELVMEAGLEKTKLGDHPAEEVELREMMQALDRGLLEQATVKNPKERQQILRQAAGPLHLLLRGTLIPGLEGASLRPIPAARQAQPKAAPDQGRRALPPRPLGVVSGTLVREGMIKKPQITVPEAVAVPVRRAPLQQVAGSEQVVRPKAQVAGMLSVPAQPIAVPRLVRGASGPKPAVAPKPLHLRGAPAPAARRAPRPQGPKPALAPKPQHLQGSRRPRPNQ